MSFYYSKSSYLEWGLTQNWFQHLNQTFWFLVEICCQVCIHVWSEFTSLQVLGIIGLLQVYLITCFKLYTLSFSFNLVLSVWNWRLILVQGNLLTCLSSTMFWLSQVFTKGKKAAVDQLKTSLLVGPICPVYNLLFQLNRLTWFVMIWNKLQGLALTLYRRPWRWRRACSVYVTASRMTP